jgi:hypothetical protein
MKAQIEKQNYGKIEENDVENNKTLGEDHVKQ